MTFPARPAKTTSIQALCLGALLFAATPAAAQSTDVDLFPPAQGSPAPAPIGAPPEHAPTDLFIPPPPPPAPPALPPREPRAQAARWQINGGLAGSLFAFDYGPAHDTSTDVHGNRGSIYIGPSVFLSPVVDNDAPRSLQPFLQHTSIVSASVGGGGFITHYANGALTRTDSYVGANADVDAYLTRHVALTGGLGYTYDVLHDDGTINKGHTFSGSTGLGLRVGNARFDASYGFSAYDVDGTFTRLRWGSVALSAFVVLAESFTITVGGSVSDGGGGGHIDLGIYTTKDLGVFAGFSGKTFEYSTTDVRAVDYAGSIGASYWIAPDLRFGATYVLGLNTTPSQPLRSFESREITHALSLGVVARLP